MVLQPRNNDDNGDDFNPEDLEFTAAEMSVFAMLVAFFALSVYVLVRVGF